MFALGSLMRASYPTIEISGDTIGKGRHVKVGRNSQQQTHVGVKHDT